MEQELRLDVGSHFAKRGQGFEIVDPLTEAYYFTRVRYWKIFVANLYILLVVRLSSKLMIVSHH